MELENANPNGHNVVISNLNNINYSFFENQKSKRKQNIV